jgi:hypothetical protein
MSRALTVVRGDPTPEERNVGAVAQAAAPGLQPALPAGETIAEAVETLRTE